MRMHYSYNVDPHDLVMEFHSTYGMPIHKGYPKILDEERLVLRMDLINEELEELIDNSDNLIETADALGDLVYVIYGMAIEMGINLGPILEEIHASNMSKLAPNGEPIYREDGKVLKGPNFREPDLKSVMFND